MRQWREGITGELPLREGTIQTDLQDGNTAAANGAQTTSLNNLACARSAEYLLKHMSV